MKLPVLAILATLLLIAADDPAQDAVTKDKKSLQGTWRLVSNIDNGEKLPVDLLPNRKIIVQGDKITEKGDKIDAERLVSQTTFSLDPSKKPKAIDATPIGRDGRPAKDNVSLGIYSLEGDTLKVCFSKPGDNRPADFTSEPGSGRNLLVLKREKP